MLTFHMLQLSWVMRYNRTAYTERHRECAAACAVIAKLDPTMFVQQSQ